MKSYDNFDFSIPQKGERAHIELTLHHTNGYGTWGSYDVPYWLVKIIRIFGKKK